jgi:hypothetical protein
MSYSRSLMNASAIALGLLGIGTFAPDEVIARIGLPDPGWPISCSRSQLPSPKSAGSKELGASRAIMPELNGELAGWASVDTAARYSVRSATIGSTRDARRAGR